MADSLGAIRMAFVSTTLPQTGPNRIVPFAAELRILAWRADVSAELLRNLTPWLREVDIGTSIRPLWLG